MRFGPFLRAWSLAALVLGVFLYPASGDSPVDSGIAKPNAAADLFEARAAGQIEVKLIPHDSAAGTVILTNKTASPLTIKLPAAFAAVPVLGQFGGRGGAGANAGGRGGGASQALGGGFGNGNVGGGNVGGGPFNIPPERVVKLKFVAVCLEHGKPEPSSRIAYDLVPIASVTSDTQVAELIEMLGRGQIGQRPAQAAAWHLVNGKTWQQLADMIGVKHLSGATEPYFSADELEKAQQAAAASRRAAASASPGEVALAERN